MADEREEQNQRTEKGLEIPVPKRSDFLRNLRKVAKAGRKTDAEGEPPKR
jgi:hypothetical protein